MRLFLLVVALSFTFSSSVFADIGQSKTYTSLKAFFGNVAAPQNQKPVPQKQMPPQKKQGKRYNSNQRKRSPNRPQTQQQQMNTLQQNAALLNAQMAKFPPAAQKKILQIIIKIVKRYGQNANKLANSAHKNPQDVYNSLPADIKADMKKLAKEIENDSNFKKQ
jgi:hypothetical protein